MKGDELNEWTINYPLIMKVLLSAIIIGGTGYGIGKTKVSTAIGGVIGAYLGYKIGRWSLGGTTPGFYYQTYLPQTLPGIVSGGGAKKLPT